MPDLLRFRSGTKKAPRAARPRGFRRAARNAYSRNARDAYGTLPIEDQCLVSGFVVAKRAYDIDVLVRFVERAV